MSSAMDLYKKDRLPQYVDHYVYMLDLEVTGMLLSGDSQLAESVKQYLIGRVKGLARKAGYAKYVILPGFGKRDVVIARGGVY